MTALKMMQGMLSGGGDLFWSNVSSLLHFDGTNGSTIFTDQLPPTWTPVGTAQISTTNPKFGTGSGAFSGGARIDSNNLAAFNLGTGDYTIEMQIIFSSVAGQQNFFDLNTVLGTNPNGRLVMYLFSGAIRIFNPPLGDIIMTGFTPVINTWYAFALSRIGTTVRFFADGIQRGPNGTSAVDVNQQVVHLGSDGAQHLSGRLDEFRFTKGVARYTSNYTPQTAPFPNGP